ncbi:MAG: autotransporter outer membrane beta-barrel domain-containing protein [Fibrobacterales bacterium]
MQQSRTTTTLITTLIIFFVLLSPCHAQFEIEVDPLAYILKGYSLHGIYLLDETKIDVGVFGLELPEDSDNKNFTVYFKGAGFKYDWYGNALDGFFTGIQGSIATVEFSYASQNKNRIITSSGVRVGYRWSWGHFFVTPWVSVDYNHNWGSEVVIQQNKYDYTSISLFPTIHLGYHF